MLHTVVFSLVFVFLFLNCQSEINNTSCAEKGKSLAALDLAKSAIFKAKKLYPNCNDGDVTYKHSVCGKKEKSLGQIDIALHLISEAQDSYPTCPPSKYQKPLQKPMDCSDVLENGQNVSGVYKIWPRSRLSAHKPLDVFCDMVTDGGGWTVIQRRGNFSNQETFYRNWKEYKNGFGNITRDFWIGNDNIVSLSNQGLYSMRFDMKAVDGERKFAHYQNFWIEDEITNYKLHIGIYHGDAGDCMLYHNGVFFSTKDRKNDEHAQSCAILRESGWWFRSCNRCNPNGLYKPGISDDKSMNWIPWKDLLGLTAMDIKLRRIQ